MDGHVHGGVWQVEEEGTRALVADEFHRLIGVALGEAILVVAGQQFDDLLIAH